MKNVLLVAGLVLSSIASIAQSDVAAWQLSSTEFGGSSRYNAMAGSFGALGGDVSVLSHNPGGIGLFRRSEISITPAFQLNSIRSNYKGTNSEDIKANINLNNFAYVSSKKLNDDSWKNVQIGISYNRLKDFHSNESIIGSTAAGTFADQLASDASGATWDNLDDTDPLYGYPAYYAYVIDPGATDLEYVSGFTGSDIKQVYQKETTGRISETAVSFGANHDDRLYLGLTLGFQRMKINSESSFSESAEYELQGAELSNYRLTENISTVGDGFTLKLGAIYRITDIVRAGFAYHSPSFMSVTSSQDTRFRSTLADGQAFTETGDAIVSEYNLSSPSKLIASAAFIINKKALLNVDYEYADYSTMKLRPGGNLNADFSDQNQDIQNFFQATNNVRVGGEVRLQPFSLRLGTAYYQNPNTDGSEIYAADRLIYTGGIGYKRNSMYIDLAYRYRNTSEDRYLYDPEFSELVDQERRGNSLSMTWGMRF